MSKDNIIAGVTDTLKALLEDRMNHRVNITTALPNFTESGTAHEDDSKDGRLNLFLYRITENASLKNDDLPGKGHPSSYGSPPLCLDLHYLLTASSSRLEGDGVGAQENLGEAMRIFHENPIITDQLLKVNDDKWPHETVINMRFKGKFEPLKIYLVPMSLDDISKLWTALNLPYRLSVAYMVSLVQIEDIKERRLPRAVGEPPQEGPRLYVLPMSVPQIREILVRRQKGKLDVESPYQYARISDIMILKGSGFGGSSIKVILGSAEAKILLQKEDRLEVEIPDDSRLIPGPQPVRVLRDTQMGEPPTSHAGFTSNQSVLMLVPHVAHCTPVLKASPRKLEIKGSRLFWSDLSAETLIGRTVATNYIVSSEKAIDVPISDVFPSSSAKCLISAKINVPLPALPNKWKLTATIAGIDGPYDIELDPAPTNISDAAKSLQIALNKARRVLNTTPEEIIEAGPYFKNLQVRAVNDKLILVPGGRDENATISFVDANESKFLNLTQLTGATEKSAYISGSLKPFPHLSADKPVVKMTVTVMPAGAVPQTITYIIQFDNRPSSLTDAATLLQKAVRNGYAGASVTALEDQLLILLDIADKHTIEFDALPGVDEGSVSELQLRASYPVRVRVNGAESIDESFVTIP